MFGNSQYVQVGRYFTLEMLQDVLDIFKRGTGEEFDFSKVKHTLEDQEQTQLLLNASCETWCGSDYDASIICLVNVWENNYFCIIIIIIGFKVHCFIYQQDVNVMTLDSLYYLLQVCVIIV